MSYALGVLAFVAILLGPPLVLGVVGGLLARRRPFVRAATAWIIGLWAIWLVYYRIVPSAVFQKPGSFESRV